MKAQRTSPGTPPPSGIDHVAIAVRDLDAATRFFRDILGLVHEGTEDVPSEGVRTAFLRAGGAAGGTRIELVSPLAGGEGPVARFLEKRGEGIHHIALRVDRIEERMEALAKAGIRLVSAGPRRGAEGAKIAFLHPSTCRGVLVELKEPAAD